MKSLTRTRLLPDAARMRTHSMGFRAAIAALAAACALPVAPGLAAAAGDPLDSLIASARPYLADVAAHSRAAAIASFAAAGAMAFLPQPVSATRIAGDPALAPGQPERVIAFGEISGNADLGLLAGPGTAGASRSASQASDWLTVWTRSPGDVWKVWIDAQLAGQPLDADAVRQMRSIEIQRGLTHVPIPTERAPGPGLLGYDGAGVGFGVGGGGGGFGVGFSMGGGGPILSGKTQIDREMAHFTNTLLSTERSWFFDRFRKNAATALTRYATEDVRVLREGQPVTTGVIEAASVIRDRTGTYDITQAAHRISSSYQLAASYGTLRIKEKGAARPDTLAFVHVWRMRADGKYQLLLDYESSIAGHCGAGR